MGCCVSIFFCLLAALGFSFAMYVMMLVQPRAPLSIETIGSFSNDDGNGNGNEKAKKAMGLLSKATTLHVHHASLYISLPSLHDYDVKMPDFTNYGGRKQETRKFSFSF